MFEKIAVISDLHLDFWSRHQNASPTELYNLIIDKCWSYRPEVIILAGDIYNGYDSLTPSVKHLQDKCPLVFVPGNHDFYGYDFPNVEDPDTVEFEEIFGTTLWTNFAGSGGWEEKVYAGISDNITIKNTSAFKVQNTCVNAYSKLLKADKEIVVTHFPPFRQSVSEKFKYDMYNSYFVNDFEDHFFSEERKTELWVVGHVHHKHMYNIRGVTVVCNPLAYPNELYSNIRQYKPLIMSKINGVWTSQYY